eukprot:gnl/TRDRNA2_/TRDRNA2_136310_c2_seq2.p1 gnl/TRDRNA2_/TRDRNA2_136310_c2~~gnl/TRDRNA2_/TRDRNA2_136310_c2_seq2.p1  ORF type:complete len:431 (+),score=42.15 gnl/TRDRNA2_/TRDRNA2_136310_c2_seq2:538-1830(+)
MSSRKYADDECKPCSCSQVAALADGDMCTDDDSSALLQRNSKNKVRHMIDDQRRQAAGQEEYDKQNSTMRSHQFATEPLGDMPSVFHVPAQTNEFCLHGHMERRAQYNQSGVLIVKNAINGSTAQALREFFLKSENTSRLYTQCCGNTLQERPSRFKQQFPEIANAARRLASELNPGPKPYELDSVYLFRTDQQPAGQPIINYSWHQDYSSFMGVEEHVHYLNVYIPLEFFDRPSKLNALSVLPRHLFSQCRSKNHPNGLPYNVSTNGGMNKWKPEWARWSGGTMNDLDYPNDCIDSLSCALETPVGDILLFRGDTIHKSGHTHKIAMSLRLVPTDTLFKKHLILKRNCASLQFATSSRFYSYLLAEMKARGVDELSVFDEARHIANVDLIKNTSAMFGSLESEMYAELSERMQSACKDQDLFVFDSSTH